MKTTLTQSIITTAVLCLLASLAGGNSSRAADPPPARKNIASTPAKKQIKPARKPFNVTDLEQRFHPFDANKNGRLDPDEHAAFERKKEELRNSFIHEFDTDRNGILSEDELAIAKAVLRDRSLKSRGKP